MSIAHSLRRPTRSTRLNRKHSNQDIVPFSWTLFVLAVFHFSVWSLGVACDPAQGYFEAHTLSLKNCSSENGPRTSVQDLLAAQQQAEEHIRATQQSLRLLQERTAAHTGSTRPAQATQQEAHLASQLAALLFLTVLQSGVGQSNESSDAAAHHCVAAQLVRE